MLQSISHGLSSALRRLALTGLPAAALQRQQLNSIHTTRSALCAVVEEEASPAVKEELDPKQLEKDRREVIPVETSIRYLRSAAYQQAYGEKFVWEQYRRNHCGPIPPRKTRKTCIRKGAIATGNPCPICRDKYLVLDHRNLELLRQFISPQTGQVLRASRTGLCQKKHLDLLVAVERAFDYGLLTFDVPFRKYDYSEFYGNNEAKKEAQ